MRTPYPEILLEPKAEQINEQRIISRPRHLVGETRSQNRRQRMDEEYIINQKQKIHIGRRYTLSETRSNIITSNSGRENIGVYSGSTQRITIRTHGTEEHIF